MRLIDADSLRDRASEYALSSDEYERFCKIIEDEPTAYDVDAVVAELEEVKERFSVEDFGIRGIVQKAIDIVKRGGAE